MVATISVVQGKKPIERPLQFFTRRSLELGPILAPFKDPLLNSSGRWLHPLPLIFNSFPLLSSETKQNKTNSIFGPSWCTFGWCTLVLVGGHSRLLDSK